VRGRSARVRIGIGLAAALAAGLGLLAFATCAGARAAFRLDLAYPTETKPQSKLWFARGRWWAWLPVEGGSSVWERGSAGWRRETALDAWLEQAPGFADVWSEADAVWAVLVGPRSLAFAQLAFDPASDRYVARGTPILWPVAAPEGPEPSGLARRLAGFRSGVRTRAIESATLARDAGGRWWIAWDEGGAIWCRASRDRDGAAWSEPFALSAAVGPIGRDDIGAIFPAAGGIGAIWTDQNRDALYFRLHRDGSPPDAWEPVETLAQGEGRGGARLANDHLHATTAADGTVYLVAKTSRYRPGEPLLALRVRARDGSWSELPYARYSRERTPSRPIAMLDAARGRAELVHESLDASLWNRHRIERVSLPLGARGQPGAPLPAPQTLLPETLDLRSPTSCKAPLPEGRDWLLLASDRFGNVYEALVAER